MNNATRRRRSRSATAVDNDNDGASLLTTIIQIVHQQQDNVEEQHNDPIDHSIDTCSIDYNILGNSNNNGGLSFGVIAHIYKFLHARDVFICRGVNRRFAEVVDTGFACEPLREFVRGVTTKAKRARKHSIADAHYSLAFDLQAAMSVVKGDTSQAIKLLVKYGGLDVSGKLFLGMEKQRLRTLRWHMRPSSSKYQIVASCVNLIGVALFAVRQSSNAEDEGRSLSTAERVLCTLIQLAAVPAVPQLCGRARKIRDKDSGLVLTTEHCHKCTSAADLYIFLLDRDEIIVPARIFIMLAKWLEPIDDGDSPTLLMCAIDRCFAQREERKKAWLDQWRKHEARLRELLELDEVRRTIPFRRQLPIVQCGPDDDYEEDEANEAGDQYDGDDAEEEPELAPDCRLRLISSSWCCTALALLMRYCRPVGAPTQRKSLIALIEQLVETERRLMRSHSSTGTSRSSHLQDDESSNGRNQTSSSSSSSSTSSSDNEADEILSPLHMAAANCDVELLEFFLDCGFDAAGGGKPAGEAALATKSICDYSFADGLGTHTAMAHVCYYATSSVKQMPVSHPFPKRAAECLNLLLDRGFKWTGWGSISWSVCWKDSDNLGDPTILAAKLGDIALLRRLVTEAGCDINAIANPFANRPLGDDEEFMAEDEYGGTADTGEDDFRFMETHGYIEYYDASHTLSSNSEGENVLSIALKRGKPDVLRVALELGADLSDTAQPKISYYHTYSAEVYESVFYRRCMSSHRFEEIDETRREARFEKLYPKLEKKWRKLKDAGQPCKHVEDEMNELMQETYPDADYQYGHGEPPDPGSEPWYLTAIDQVFPGWKGARDNELDDFDNYFLYLAYDHKLTYKWLKDYFHRVAAAEGAGDGADDDDAADEGECCGDADEYVSSGTESSGDEEDEDDDYE